MRVELSAAAFPSAAVKFERQLPGSVSQLLLMGFLSVVAELEVDQRSGKSAIQLHVATFPCAAAGFGPHSDALSEDRVELELLCHSLHLCGHGAAA